jgi:hypothetical protein
VRHHEVVVDVSAASEIGGGCDPSPPVTAKAAPPAKTAVAIGAGAFDSRHLRRSRYGVTDASIVLDNVLALFEARRYEPQNSTAPNSYRGHYQAAGGDALTLHDVALPLVPGCLFTVL